MGVGAGFPRPAVIPPVSKPRILAFGGSIRRDSLNQKLAATAFHPPTV